MDRQKPTAELINIIKDLYYNSTTGGGSGGGAGGSTTERDNIISRVDKQFEECDGRIDKYIRNSSKDLTRLIKVFNDIARKIEASRGNVRQSREALKQCKVLLQSKRDDVRRLWLEWCMQKCYYDNLLKLKHVHTAGEQVRLCTAEKKYLRAAELVSEATRLVDTEFRDVSGLNEIKRQLDDERIKLERHLLAELTEQLYTSVTREVLESGGSAANAMQPMNGGGAVTSGKASRRFYRAYPNSDSAITGAGSGGKYSAEASEAMIQAIVQSAAKLNSQESNINILEKMINDINKDMIHQLIAMINATSHHVVESNLIGNISHSHRKFVCI
jgi:hypothetical protein